MVRLSGEGVEEVEERNQKLKRLETRTENVAAFCRD
jgi:hypothetical protein